MPRALREDPEIARALTNLTLALNACSDRELARLVASVLPALGLESVRVSLTRTMAHVVLDPLKQAELSRLCAELQNPKLSRDARRHGVRMTVSALLGEKVALW